MRKIKVAIDTYEFDGWSGGIDFIKTIAEGIIGTNEAEIGRAHV